MFIIISLILGSLYLFDISQSLEECGFYQKVVHKNHISNKPLTAFVKTNAFVLKHLLKKVVTKQLLYKLLPTKYSLLFPPGES